MTLCDICIKDIKAKSLAQHQRCVHSPKNFACDQWTYKRGRNSQLQVHKRSKHNVDMIICVFCGASLTTAALLIRHHTAKHFHVKSYIFPICHKAFGRKDSLKRHPLLESISLAHSWWYWKVNINTYQKNNWRKIFLQIKMNNFKSRLHMWQFKKQFFTG